MALQTFLYRRQALLAKMLPGSAALFFSAPECRRNADSEYPYRQNSDFWYLTGFNEPQALLLLIKSDDKHNHSVLFNRPNDLVAEVWSGRRLGQEAALTTLGIDRALPFTDIAEQLHLLLNGLDVVYHAQGIFTDGDNILFAALEKLRGGVRYNWHAPATLTDWRPWVHEMRLFKSAEEIELMRRAADISAMAHTRAMEKCRPGMFEYQLEGEILHEFLRHGARYPAYNTIVGGGSNGCILHYTENQSQLQDGMLVLVDAGCEYQGYAGDITRTFPVNGKFTPPQRSLYNVVLAALNKALAILKPGSSIYQANEAVVEVMVKGLVELGILQGDVEQLVLEKAYRQFYMHGLSHWLGLDVHDVGDYGSSLRERLLEPGMVLTCEPGLYIPPDAEVALQYRGIGIRIEDDILITEQGIEVLSKNVVKTVDEIETLMAKAQQNK